jgi:hypothetical protein
LPVLSPFPPLSEQNCQNCRFSAPLESPELQCRRYAPRPDDYDGMLTAWPAVLGAHWCGEWQAKEDAFLG